MCLFSRPSPADLCCDKWACKKPADFMDESAQFQELREDDNSASEITYGEVEQRLGQLQEHLNRFAPPTAAQANCAQPQSHQTARPYSQFVGNLFFFFF